ncbi:hypothetical protein D3C71_2025450 [compost metagenome]
MEIVIQRTNTEYKIKRTNLLGQLRRERNHRLRRIHETDIIVVERRRIIQVTHGDEIALQRHAGHIEYETVTLILALELLRSAMIG